jgi:plastocyanin
MKAFFSIVVVLFCALVALPAASATPTAAPAASATPAAAPAATVVVHIHDFQFDPETVTVAPGTTVEWDNDDGARHTVTAADKSFDSGDLKPGTKWSYTFAAAGTFAYGCTQHPEMTGSVTVK